MADESERFHTIGPTWAERAKLNGLRSVLVPGGHDATDRINLFLNGIHCFAAKRALQLKPGPRVAVDFGCGSGRFVRFFGDRGWKVIGTEITPEMIKASERYRVPKYCQFCLTNGILMPLSDGSVDVVWCCGVLRYSLLVADPVYDQIAREMFRVLRPGGLVVNVEMYVTQEPGTFVKDFEAAGFVTAKMHVIQRYGGRLERFLTKQYWPMFMASWLGELCARLRYYFDCPKKPAAGLRDYLFFWEKPDTARPGDDLKE